MMGPTTFNVLSITIKFSRYKSNYRESLFYSKILRLIKYVFILFRFVKNKYSLHRKKFCNFWLIIMTCILWLLHLKSIFIIPTVRFEFLQAFQIYQVSTQICQVYVGQCLVFSFLATVPSVLHLLTQPSHRFYCSYRHRLRFYKEVTL